MAQLNSLTIGGQNLTDIFYPIGTIYETKDSSVNPQDLWGGSWVLEAEEYDRRLVGSQVLYDSITGTGGSTSYTNVLGAYGDTLISGVFQNTESPEGYHQEYRLTFQATCLSNNQVQVALNNIESPIAGTWSNPTFRIMASTPYFKISDIVYETTMTYSQSGINLKYKVNNPSTSHSYGIYNITIHGYIVSDEPVYKWKRTA